MFDLTPATDHYLVEGRKAWKVVARSNDQEAGYGGREWIVLDVQTMLRKLHCTVLCGRFPFFLLRFPMVLPTGEAPGRNSIGYGCREQTTNHA